MTGILRRPRQTTTVAACMLWIVAAADAVAQLPQEGGPSARVRLSFDAEAPRLAGDAQVRRWVADELPERLDLTDDELTVDERPHLLGDYTVVRVSQTARELPIVYRESRLLLDDDGTPVYLQGFHSSFRPAPEPAPRLSVAEAFAAAGGDEDDTSSSELVFWPSGDELRLSYRLEGSFPDAADRLAPRERVFVDASTAQVLERLSLTRQRLERRIFDFGLACRQAGVAFPIDEFQAELVISNSPLVRSENINMGHDLAERYFRELGYFYSFLRTTLEMDSIDDRGEPLAAFIGVKFMGASIQCVGDENNAMWTGQFALLPYSAIRFRDTIGHEFTHGLIERGSDLIYTRESGALNESISDVVGVTFSAWLRDGSPSSVDAPIRMTSRDWVLEFDDGPIRDMRNPRRIGGNPDHYDDYVYGGGVHTNSSIINQSFYLLSEGGRHPRLRRGPVVDGIGVMKAMRIFAAGGVHLLTPRADFEDARYAFAGAAEAYHGRGSPEWIATHTAMDAVGIDGFWQRPPPTPNTPPRPRPPAPPGPVPPQDDPPEEEEPEEEEPEEEEPEEEEPGGEQPEEEKPDDEVPEDEVVRPANTDLLILLLIAGLALLLVAAAVYRYRYGRTPRVPAGPAPAPEPHPSHRFPPPDPVPAPAHQELGVLRPMDGSQPIPLPKDQLSSSEGLLIGRDARICGVTLQNPSVSRKHLRLRVSNGRFLVEDLNSLDGTYLDGARLKPFEPHPIASGQTLSIAGERLRLERGEPTG